MKHTPVSDKWAAEFDCCVFTRECKVICGTVLPYIKNLVMRLNTHTIRFSVLSQLPDLPALGK